MRNLLIVTCDRYPEGNAGAVREHIFAKAYKQLGYSVAVIGLGETTGFEFKKYDNVKYISLRSKSGSVVCRILDRLFFGRRLKKILHEKKADAILFTQLSPCCTFMLKRYAKSNNIPLIHDSVEWFSREEYKYWFFDITYIENAILNRFMVDDKMSVIAISEYLREHFSKKTNNVCRIPFVIDATDIECEKKLNQEKIVIMYAGSIGKKDSFDSIIDAFGMLDAGEQERVELRIIGYSKKGFMETTQISEERLAKVKKCIRFLGRVSREEVKNNLLEANFTILMRPPQKRYAKAGFPTKVSESLAYCTPVIANLSSDLGLYLKDGINSVIIRDNTTEALHSALKYVLSLEYEKLEEMSKEAGNTAKTMLDYKLFLQDFEKMCLRS